MKRVAYLIYGLVAYLLFAFTLVYAIGFVADFGVPKSINSGDPAPLSQAIAINCALLGLFAVQHSGMARKRFKQFLTTYVPQPIERSTYVLATCAALLLMFAAWQPMPQTLWRADSMVLATLMQTLSLAGWAVVAISTINIHHFDLFGVRQVWVAFRERAAKDLGFRTPGLYKIVRHPIQVGFLIAFWATPHMTYGWLLFSVMCTGYIFFAVKVLEERDLLREFPERYGAYMEQVGGFIPKLPRRTAIAAVESSGVYGG